MIKMRAIESYAELESTHIGDHVILTVSVAEIIERPLYFRIMAVMEVIGSDVIYVAIDVEKNGMLSDVDWIRFRALSPLDGIKVVAKKTRNHHPRFTLVNFITICKMETPHYVQYCNKCDDFEFVANSNAYIQCHADRPGSTSYREISKFPMKLRSKFYMNYGKELILYPIKPAGLYEEFLPDQLDTEININHILCPACGNSHTIYNLRSRRTGNVFKYCPITNQVIQIDQETTKEEPIMNQTNINEADLQPAKKEEFMDFTGHTQIPVNGMFGSKNEDGPANDYAVCPEHALETAQKAIDEAKRYNDSVGTLSDGYHTFDELYHHRALLFASLCLTGFKEKAWKSLLHSDSKKDPMYPGMFIVGVETPFGQATYHYDIDPYWSIFKVRELDHAPEYDGHTPKDAIDRIYKYALKLGSTINRSFSDGLVTIPCGTTTARNINTTGNPVLDGDVTLSCEDRPVV